MNEHEKYMRRCIELAKQGTGYVAPNPMVGAVLVHDGKIIGEVTTSYRWSTCRSALYQFGGSAIPSSYFFFYYLCGA